MLCLYVVDAVTWFGCRRTNIACGSCTQPVHGQPLECTAIAASTAQKMKRSLVIIVNTDQFSSPHRSAQDPRSPSCRVETPRIGTVIAVLGFPSFRRSTPHVVHLTRSCVPSNHHHEEEHRTPAAAAAQSIRPVSLSQHRGCTFAASRMNYSSIN